MRNIMAGFLIFLSSAAYADIICMVLVARIQPCLMQPNFMPKKQVL